MSLEGVSAPQLVGTSRMPSVPSGAGLSSAGGHPSTVMAAAVLGRGAGTERGMAALPRVASHAGGPADTDASQTGGRPPDATPGSSATVGSGSAADGPQHRPTVRSVWRWPSQPGKLPAYVEGNFRVKTFGLLTLQFAVVLCMVVVVERHLPMYALTDEQCHVAFAAMGVLTLVTLTILYCVKDWYPANYILLFFVTLLVGMYWGMGYGIFSSHVHFHLISIMGIGALVSTITSAVLSFRSKMDGWCVVLTSVYLGWAVGSVVNVTAVQHFYDIEGQLELVAVLVAFFLFTVLVLDVGARLVHCNPDDFMRVIISMDSALLVVVSIPVFIISACILRADDYPDMMEAAEPAEQGDHVM
mmetsp:Transcript_62155/g.172279  ORF Transcript_62155/g.172279 Transcript_62155/m.172279 type:complete len:358 (-) Transcript_62155:439-1512(-)